MINTALRLPAPEIEALLQGRIIAVMPNKFITPGREFALCPADASINLLPVEQYYRSNFLPIAQSTFAQLNSQGVLIQPQQMSLLSDEEQLKLSLLAYETVLVKAWANCELCQIINNAESLVALSHLTIWTKKGLQEILTQRHNIFLAYLRVYQLPKSIEVAIKSNSLFISLPQSLNVSEEKPVLNDRTFAQRKRQLEKLEPALHPELEELQSAIASLTISQPAAKELDDDIKAFLGWSSDKAANPLDLDLPWIHKIAEVGNSSDGHTFEKLVRRGLLKLGFTGSSLNPDATGGAGGMDFYTEQPYPIVGECKATKTEKVTDGTPAQLLKIGMNHLGRFQYDNSIKLIVAAGELNFYASRTATENQMNVISPETLQKLVELQAHYKNSINLLELKECLQQAPFGLAEDKINTYIDKVEQSIRLRSHIIQLVKNYLENSGIESAGVESLHGAYFGSHPPQPIKTPEMHEILIELSSPLTGYLGRIKGSDWKSDRFTFSAIYRLTKMRSRSQS
ncbi:DUF1802 family protein [Nostoc sp. 'Peltigera malacea cyanobiont' DB3992]|uniref:DUF1802 family protein n=1 Tax=Nostoc sp. 'Peltigera malacea cyanobiont' DB3992 TaxID=1206980 RepID=UPI000C044196|nr:DUF1802 family protein [Nostoc sp. 'Peltigera malacea cyanobiont' DB3992]PHM07428.1 DUF1802 domain-containing protein [Nostoc sp. 'Peltigera malacea cyanobiont' DB3992]